MNGPNSCWLLGSPSEDDDVEVDENNKVGGGDPGHGLPLSSFKYPSGNFVNGLPYIPQFNGSLQFLQEVGMDDDSFYGFDTVIDNSELNHLDDTRSAFKKFAEKLVAASSDNNNTGGLLDDMGGDKLELEDVVRSINSTQPTSLESIVQGVMNVFASYQSALNSSHLHLQLTTGGIKSEAHTDDGEHSDSGFSNASSVSTNHSSQRQLDTTTRKLGSSSTIGRLKREELPCSAAIPINYLTRSRDKDASSNTGTSRGQKKTRTHPLFGDLDVPMIFKRSEDGRTLWRDMETNTAFVEKEMDREPENNNKNSKKKVRKVERHGEVGEEVNEVKKDDRNTLRQLLVRILGYHLMDVEKRCGRLITAQERREFMTTVAAELPIRLTLVKFVNSNSKGLLDMFVRNKRHYQNRKYGIGLPAQVLLNKGSKATR